MKSYPRYTISQIIVHWLSALCVLIAVLLPLMRDFWTEKLGGIANVYMLHKSFGVLIFALTIWRIYLVIKCGVPEVLPKHEKLQRILSKSVQGIIYILLLILPLSGYLMSNRAINFFGLFELPTFNLPLSAKLTFHSLHIISAYLLLVLLVLHIVAALYHHYWVKDNVLKSMLPLGK